MQEEVIKLHFFQAKWEAVLGHFRHKRIRIKRFRSQYADTFPDSMLQEIPPDYGAEGSLGNDRLARPFLHAFIIICYLV
jgi:hypothetical protein